MHQLVYFSSTAGWTAVVYPTNSTACLRPMMRRSSAQHGKLQKSWPLLWHPGISSPAAHGMSNLTHVSRPFSCAAGLGAGGKDAIGLVLSVHLRAFFCSILHYQQASLGIYYHWGGLHFFRHNHIYQWDTSCTNIQKIIKYIYIYIYQCVSTSAFPIFARNWYLLIP